MRAADASPVSITLGWLARLRWGAAAGQVTTIAIARFALGLEVPLLPLGLLVALTVASNVALTRWLAVAPYTSETAAGLVLCGDILILTGLLYFAGGPSNPFSVLYLVHVTLAALVLGLRWAGALVALSSLSYAGLFFWHLPLAGAEHAQHGGPGFSTHLQGMFVAFTLAACLIAYFVARLAAALRAREADLARMQRAVARHEKLAALTTLSAGAAHELGSPLGTIAVASRELESTIIDRPEEAVSDARLIRAEVERCRTIVQRMSAQAGMLMGEVPETTLSESVITQCLRRLGEAASRITFKPHGREYVHVPSEGLIQVLLNLIQNALQASLDPDAKVEVAVRRRGANIRFEILDHGVGIASENLRKVGDPFFTTKQPGEGMGLGVYLARSFAERWGGALELHSVEGRGTEAMLELPRGNAREARG